MSDLKKELIKLGSTHPELRPHIREILAASTKLYVEHYNADGRLRHFSLMTNNTTKAHIGKLVKKALYWDGIPAYWVEETGTREVTISYKGDMRGARAVIKWEPFTSTKWE